MIEQAYRVGNEFFASKEEAEAYEAAEGCRARINKYIASREWARGQDTSARNALNEFFAWEAKQVEDDKNCDEAE